MTININPNTPITGTVTTRIESSDQQLFKEYYRCSVEVTQRKSYQGIAFPVTIGTQPFNPDESVGMEKVIAIYMTESMYDDLIHRTSEMIKEDNSRRKNPVLMDLWSKYKMMMGLLK